MNDKKRLHCYQITACTNILLDFNSLQMPVCISSCAVFCFIILEVAEGTISVNSLVHIAMSFVFFVYRVLFMIT